MIHLVASTLRSAMFNKKEVVSSLTENLWSNPEIALPLQTKNAFGEYIIFTSSLYSSVSKSKNFRLFCQVPCK